LIGQQPSYRSTVVGVRRKWQPGWFTKVSTTRFESVMGSSTPSTNRCTSSSVTSSIVHTLAAARLTADNALLLLLLDVRVARTTLALVAIINTGVVIMIRESHDVV
jgi:hypothetical protein